MRKYGFLASCIVIVFGLMWSNLAFANGRACPPRGDCKELLVLAKLGNSPETDCFSCSTRCTERGCDDIIIRMKRRVTLNPKDCDETNAIDCIPAGSIMYVDLTYHIRQNGPCPPTSEYPLGAPVGTHEGRFKITAPPVSPATTGAVIASGKMKGTNGLETHVNTEECCAWPHDEGCMESKNVKCGEHTCKLIATYSSDLDLDPERLNPNDLCASSNWANWTLNIDGILLCPCEED